MQMTRSIRKSLVGLLVAGLAGCTGTVGTAPEGDAGGPGGPGAGGSTGVAGSTGSGGSNPTGVGGSNPTGVGGSNPTGVGGNPGAAGSPIIPDGPCKVGIPATSQVPRLTTLQYDNVMKELLGVTTLTSNGGKPPSDLLVPDFAGNITDIAWNGYLSAAEKIAGEVMAGTNKSKFIKCDPAAANCLNDTIKQFGRKLFRRPVADTEVTSFMRLNTLTPTHTATDVAEAVLYAMLASPSFIMVPELAQTKEGDFYKLNSYEVASRLSLLIWGNVPDDTLNTAADAGQVQTKEQILGQAQRMLMNKDKTMPAVAAFARYYLDIRNGSHWGQVDHDKTKFPAYASTAVTPMMTEMESFFQEIAFTNGAFKDLFLSPVGFINKDTAPLYGLTSTATALTKTTLSTTDRPGFLTRAGFLASFSSYSATSPILRGAFITGRVLGIPLGTPDPKNTQMQPPAGINYTTRRQQIETLTMPDNCMSCHGIYINPPGFVLEKYSSIGTTQTKDPLGGDINGTADVMVSTDVTKTISSPLQLMQEIAKSPDAIRQYAEGLVSYATNRLPNANDACTVDALSKKMTETYPLLNLFADFTQADSFRLRTLGN
jgi:hypothetical protein